MSGDKKELAGYLRTPVTFISDDACSARQLSWIHRAIALGSPSGSPYAAFKKLSEHASELTPNLQDLTERAYRSMLAPMPMACLLDKEDAKDLVDMVIEKVATRAEKRKHEAALRRCEEQEAAAEEEARKEARGAGRAALRQAIASRPVKNGFAIDNCGRRV